MKFNFWQKWLMVMGVVWMLMAVYLLIIALTKTGVSYVNSAFWTSGVPAEAANFQAYIYGTYSAVALSFGTFVLFITSRAFRNREKWAWNCLACSFVIWVVVDSLFSVINSVFTNAYCNILLFILLFLPLLFTRKEFRKQS